MHIWNLKLNREALHQADFERLIRQSGGLVLAQLARLPWVTVQMPGEPPAHPGIVYSELDTSCDSCPGPQLAYVPDGLAPARIAEAQQRATGYGARVAILDTGLGYRSLAHGFRVGHQESFVSGEDIEDQNGHGTATTSLVAETAPEAEILMLKALNRQGKGRWSWVAQALERATELQAQVAVMALGGPDPSLMMEEALAQYVEGGGIPVAASGNSGAGALDYPGSSAFSIAVAAVDARGRRPKWSSWAPWPTGPDIAAPGVSLRVPSFKRPEGYEDVSGTSMSTAVAGGVLALAVSARRIVGRDALLEARRLFSRTATPARIGGRDVVGYGIINAEAMVNA